MPSEVALQGASHPDAGRTIVHDLLDLLQSRVSQLVLTVLLGVAAARIWGPKALGIVALAQVVPNMVTDGFDLGTSKSLPYLIGRRNHTLQEVMSAALMMFLMVTCVSMVVTFLILFSPWMHDVPLLWGMLGILTIPVTLMVGYSQAFAIGVQRLSYFKHMVWLRDPVQLAVVLIGGLALGFGAPEDGWIRLLAVIIGTSVAAAAGLRLMSRFVRLAPRWNYRLSKELVGKSCKFGLGMWTMRLNYNLGLVLLGIQAFHVPTQELGNYRVAMLLGMMLWQIPGIFGTVVFSRGVNTTDRQRASRQAALLARVSTFAGFPFALGLFVLSPYVIPLIYGKDFAQAGTLVQILLPGMLAFFGARAFDADLSARGLPLVVVSVMGPLAVLNCVLAVVLIPKYGANGTAMASTVCYALGTILLGIVFARRTGLTLAEVFVPRVSDFQLVADRLLRFAQTRLGRTRKRPEEKAAEQELDEGGDPGDDPPTPQL